MDPFEEIKQTFFQECDEQLADLEAGLLALQEGAGDADTINAVFRAVHSMKGGAGAFGMEALVRFAHVFETLLDELRSGRKDCDEETVKTLLRAADVLADHVQAERGGAPVDAARSAAMTAELEACIGGTSAETMSAEELEDFDFQPVRFDAEADEEPAFEPVPAEATAPDRTAWRIVLHPKSSLYAKANDAGLLLRELARLGEVSVERLDENLPPLDTLLSEQAYIGWSVRLVTDKDEAAIREVFEWVDGDCGLEITRDGEPPEPFNLDALLEKVGAVQAALQPRVDEPQAKSKTEATAPAAPPAPALRRRAAEFGAACGRPRRRALDHAQGGRAGPGPGQTAGQPPPLRRRRSGYARAANQAAAQTTIRVDLDRVDRLIDLVGELVIQQAMLSQRVIEQGLSRATAVAVGLDDLEQLTREIQDSVMAIRAQPVKSVFQRMPRLVREVSELVGKKVRLVTEGEATEVDKTVIERLSDPITHMIRNAVDHGLEATEKRIAAGKPPEGTVRLAALHRSGRIIIEVEDDGGGINRAARARDRGQQEADRARRRPHRRGDGQPDLPAGLLHRLDRVGHLRPRRGHGRGQALDPGARRAHLDQLHARQGLEVHAQPAADARGAGRHGGHRRRPDPGRAADRHRREPAAAGART